MAFWIPEFLMPCQIYLYLGFNLDRYCHVVMVIGNIHNSDQNPDAIGPERFSKNSLQLQFQTQSQVFRCVRDWNYGRQSYS